MPNRRGWWAVAGLVAGATAAAALQAYGLATAPAIGNLLKLGTPVKYALGLVWVEAVLLAGVRITRRRALPPPLVFLAGLILLIPWLMLLGTWGDEWEYLANLDSLVRDGDLDTLNQLAAPSPDALLRYGRYQPLLPWFGPGAAHGYTPHALCYGYLAWLLPGWALAGRFGAHLMSALAAVLLWLAVDRYRRPFPNADRPGLTWLLVLSTPVLAYTFHLYPELLASAIAVFLLADAWRAERFQPWRWGTLAALLLWLNWRFLLLAAPLCLVVLRRQGKRSVVAIGLCLALAGLLVLLQLPVLQGLTRAGKEAEYFSPALAVGLLGNFLDGEYGVLPYAPLWAFLPVGALVLWRTHRDRLIDILIVTVPYLLVMSSYRAFWYGGQAPPARFVAVLFPLWFPLLAAAIPPATARGWRRLWTAAVAVTLLVSLALTVVPSWRYNVRVDGENQVLRALAPPLAQLLPAFRVPAIAATSWALAVGYLIFWGGFVALAWRGYGRPLVHP